MVIILVMDKDVYQKFMDIQVSTMTKVKNFFYFNANSEEDPNNPDWRRKHSMNLVKVF